MDDFPVLVFYLLSSHAKFSPGLIFFHLAGTKFGCNFGCLPRSFSQKANHSAAGLNLDAVGVIVVLPEP